MVEDDGKGPVEKGAHFYRSLQIDAHGNPINKRNAWATRAVVYVRLIPPGAADTVHYRVQIPRERRQQDHVARSAVLSQVRVVGNAVLFRRSSPIQRQPATQVTPDYDDRKFTFTASLQGVSAKQEKIPDVPIVTRRGE